MNKLVLIGIAIAALLGFGMFGEHRPPNVDTAAIAAFVYSHSGSSTYEMYSYEIDTDESGAPAVYYELNNGNEMYTLPADGELMQELAAIVDDHELRKWDGFNKTNSFVMDGSGFYLRIDFDDGTSISARGSNSFPDGYSEAAAAIDGLFQGHLEKHGVEQGGV